MKIIGRILLTLSLLAVFAFASIQIGCQDNSPKNVDNDKKADELEMPDIDDGEGDDEDADGEGSEKNEKGNDDSSGEAALSGPKN